MSVAARPGRNRGAGRLLLADLPPYCMVLLNAEAPSSNG